LREDTKIVNSALYSLINISTKKIAERKIITRFCFLSVVILRSDLYTDNRRIGIIGDMEADEAPGDRLANS